MEFQKIIKKLDRRGLLPLQPKSSWSEELDKAIQSQNVKEIIKSALYLWNDNIHQAHLIAQQINNADGSLCHAILHRREGDFSNSKYWLRHSGNHPAFKPIQKTHPGWDPYQFVDQCEDAIENQNKNVIKNLETIQYSEINSVINHLLEKYN